MAFSVNNCIQRTQTYTLAFSLFIFPLFFLSSRLLRRLKLLTVHHFTGHIFCCFLFFLFWQSTNTLSNYNATHSLIISFNNFYPLFTHPKFSISAAETLKWNRRWANQAPQWANLLVILDLVPSGMMAFWERWLILLLLLSLSRRLLADSVESVTGNPLNISSPKLRLLHFFSVKYFGAAFLFQTNSFWVWIYFFLVGFMNLSRMLFCWIYLKLEL